MRDAHRMKEKLDLSLDHRQIVSAIVAGLVVLGAVFVLGVVVGKKLASATEAQAAPDLLSALDARAAAMDEARATAPALTFQDELTRKSPDAPAAAEPPRPQPQPKAELAVARAPEAAAPAPLEPAAAVVPQRAQVIEPGAEVAPQGAVREAPRAEAVATRVAEKAPGAPTAVASGNFTLQLSATQTRAEADRFVGKLRAQGYAPYVVEAEVPGKGTWYRVRMGRFPTRDAAGRYLVDFRRETRLDAFVASAQ